MNMYCDYDDLAAQVDEAMLLQAADMSEPPTIKENLPVDTPPDIPEPPVEDIEPMKPPERDTITPAIISASAEVAGYLARRYKLPSSPEESPAMLRKLTADIAIYNVFSRKGFAFAEQVKDHIIVRRYDAAIEYLKAVAEDEADIDGLVSSKTPDDEDGEGGSYGSEFIPMFRR